MLNINNKALSTFKAKLIDRSISSNEIITINDWLDGSIQPTFIRQQDKFKSINLVILLEGINEDDAFIQFSKLTAELQYCLLKFNDMPYTFNAVLDGSVEPKRLKPGVFEISYSLRSGYAMAAETIVNRAAGASTSLSITNPGTAPTPCVLELTPTQAIASLTFTGFTDKPFTIKNLVSGQKVVIDGEKNSITMNGNNNFNNFDGWSFPALKPGANALAISSSLGYSMIIKYKARYK